jgi:ferredoxin-NADP reductase
LPTPIKVAAQIVDIIEHTDDLRSFVMKPERRIPAFIPGQFLHLAIDAYAPGMHWPDSRVFSIASSPKEREHVRVTISRQGQFTSRMFNELRLGSTVWLKLPYGTFCPSADQSERMVMLAGGSGVTPFISFLEWAVVERPQVAIDLHYGARTAELLIYRNTIEQCRQRGLQRLNVRYYVEQADGGASDQELRVGRISASQAWNDAAEPNRAKFYLSGPRTMIDLFRSQLVGLGADRTRVLSDDWS